jgi:hypothetical protein
MNNLVVAGGAVLAALTLGDASDENESRDAARAALRDARETTSDIDLFVVADSDAQAQAVYQRVLRHFAARIAAVQELPDFEEGEHVPPYKVCKQLLVVRSAKAVTFVAGYPQRHVQLILRRHRSVGDVIWNFDVDACQLAYDGEKVYATPAARRALTSGIIFADPTVACPSYELRLVKYSQRGFAVAVPGLDMSRVKSSLKEGIFTMKAGKLLPLRLTFKKREEGDDDEAPAEMRRRVARNLAAMRLPDYEVIETPITGLGKLVALSTLAWGTEKNRRDERREQQLMLREGEVTSENVCEIGTDINVEPKSFLISTHNLDVAKGEPEGRPHNVEWRKETPPHWPPVKMQQKLFVDEEGFDTYNRGVHSMLRYHFGFTPSDAREKLDDAVLNDGEGVSKLYMVWDYIPDVTTAAPETPFVRDFNALHEANQGGVPPWLNPDGLIPTPTVDLPQTLAFPAGDSTFERSGQESWFLTEDVYENK